jgi:SAM-dependent methyltransferase
MPQVFIVNAVLKAIERLPGFPNLNVLDLSCGEGQILQQLQARGCKVHGTHFQEHDYIIKNRDRLGGFGITSGVNLHGPLPFDTGSFDVVIMSEVLEHLEWHGKVILEAGRILRNGGYLLFTTPNIFRLHSRMQFFLTGKHKLSRRRTGWDLRPEELYAYHITPVDFPLMHTLLHQAKLTIIKLGCTRIKLFQIAFYGLLYPVVWLSCKITSDRKSASATPAMFAASESDLNRWLCDPALLFSEQILLLAQKTAS